MKPNIFNNRNILSIIGKYVCVDEMDMRSFNSTSSVFREVWLENILPFRHEKIIFNVLREMVVRTGEKYCYYVRRILNKISFISSPELNEIFVQYSSLPMARIFLERLSNFPVENYVSSMLLWCHGLNYKNWSFNSNFPCKEKLYIEIGLKYTDFIDKVIDVEDDELSGVGSLYFFGCFDIMSTVKCIRYEDVEDKITPSTAILLYSHEDLIKEFANKENFNSLDYIDYTEFLSLNSHDFVIDFLLEHSSAQTIDVLLEFRGKFEVLLQKYSSEKGKYKGKYHQILKRSNKVKMHLGNLIPDERKSKKQK